ncbi:MAG: PIG-L family deacetylase [Leptospirales bacterium]|nr:PIG-L family deacetylase [Leptospirales bacterium]
MGGTVASLAMRGIPVRLLDLTNGEPTPFGTPEIRKAESRKSAEVLGADRITMDMPNRFLEDTIENRKRIASEIRAFRPDYVFAPYAQDAHPDHVAANKLAVAARFYAKLSKSDIPGDPCFPSRVLFYFPVHVRLRINPSFLSDISDTVRKKEEAIRCYESQFIRSGKESFIENVIIENKYWGFQGNCAAAEPFFQEEVPLFKSWPEGYL